MTLFRSGIIVAFFTLLSRIFGLLRELFVASLFGTSNVADCVNVAFKLPNLFRRIFGEGALSTVFIPIFNEKILISGTQAKKFTGQVFILLFITLVIITLLMQIFMPSLMVIIAPGFYQDPSKFKLTVQLTRITMPYLIFISITALFGGILNSKKRFAAFSATPIIMSLCVIIFTWVFQGKCPASFAISYALVIAGALQVLFMLYCLFKADALFPINARIIFNQDVKRFLSNLGPAVLSSGAQQLNLFISQSIASFLPGVVSILTYADRIYQFPLSMIGVTYATILLPELSKVYKTNDHFLVRKIQTKAVKSSLFLSLPAAFGIAILSQPIIHIIYERGAFDALSTFKTAITISIFALGLPAFVLTRILLPIFYANHDTKTPFAITLRVILLNIVSNIILISSLAHGGIALGSSLAAWYNVWLLYSRAKKNYGFALESGVKEFCLKTIFCTILMSIVIIFIYYFFGDYYYNAGSITKIFSLLFTIIIGSIVFFISSIYFNLHKILMS